jgi:hypothetical protein
MGLEARWREHHEDQTDKFSCARHVTYNACCRWLASTTFEPNEARRAFPCFDEPGFKARFQVNLASRDDVVALSNMPRRSQHNMYVCQRI